MSGGVPVDLQNDGVLWMVNRTTFHPRGFALGWDPATGELTLLGDGTEPWVFDGTPEMQAAEDERFGAFETMLARARTWAAPADLSRARDRGPSTDEQPATAGPTQAAEARHGAAQAVASPSVAESFAPAELQGPSLPAELSAPSPFALLIAWLRALDREVVADHKRIDDLAAAQLLLEERASGLEARVSELESEVNDLIAEIDTLFPPLATGFVASVTNSQGEQIMGLTISIDDTGANVVWNWTDDKGDTNAAAPVDASGAAVTVAVSSDNSAAASIGGADQTAQSAPISPVAEGGFNAVFAFTDSTGAPAVWPADTPNAPDGTVLAGSAISAAPLALTVGPGLAVAFASGEQG